MHFRPMRIDADLNRFHSEIAETRRLRFTNQHRIGLEFDAEGKGTRALENFEEILAKKNLAAAKGEDKDAGFGHLFEQVLDFRRGHLTVVLVIEIAVNTLLIATVSEINLRAEGNAQPQRPLAHLLHQGAHGCCCSCTGAPVLAIGCSEIGCSEIRRMPCLAKSWARDSASR